MTGTHPVLRLEIGQFSHPGRRRPNNEDWLGTFQPEDPERMARKGSLFLVADGMGGHQAGEVASRRAVDHVIRTYMEDPSADVPTSLGRAIESANAALHAEASGAQGRRRRGTTLVAAVVRHGELWIANVGDSRAYVLRHGKLRQLSRDHSLASAGGLEPPQGEWIGRHIITRALGLKPSVEVDLYPPLKLQARDRLLLCTDGLTTPLTDQEIRDIIAEGRPQRAADALVQAANDKGGPDNVSVIVVEVAGVDGEPVWESPGELLLALTRPQTWQWIIESVVGGEEHVRSPVFIALVVLFVLAVVGLGFVLGLVLFGS